MIKGRCLKLKVLKGELKKRNPQNSATILYYEVTGHDETHRHTDRQTDAAS